MDSRVLKFLIGALYIYCQVHAADDAYNGELMVESNVTVEIETILSALNSTDIQVNDTNSTPHDVTLLDSGVISGMVTIEAPETTKYLSNPTLKCTLEEETDRAGWNMSRKHERFELNNGTV
eukprot:superscaffoldBa00005832_g20838